MEHVRSVELVGHGLHVRPITSILSVAKKYQARLQVCHGESTADGRSAVDMISLQAGPGSVLVFRAEGEDAVRLLDELESLVRRGFHAETSSVRE